MMPPNPIPAICPHCEEPILPGDDLARNLIGWEGVPRLLHEECSLRLIIGGLNHLKKLCTCCPGGTLPPDPPGMSKRSAAQAAATCWRQMNERKP